MFSHIYVERGAFGRPETRRILSKFPEARVILIGHYKDVFNRRRQDPVLQHREMSLIIAEKHGQLLYRGAPVCQRFGNEHFYYTSCAMNCLFDCEYCYLKGMYPSGDMVLFVNQEDYFRETERYLAEHPVYLCISYDTDLLAIEGITGFVGAWLDFAAMHENLTVEVRTKSGRTDFFETAADMRDRMIFAYTISPEEIIRDFEHGTASLRGRLRAARHAMEAGFPVRLCFDPMIYVPEWRALYGRMMETVREETDLARIRDFSIGTFRISAAYLKTLRRTEPDSAAVWYPFALTDGYYHYPDRLEKAMETFLEEAIRQEVPGAEIFRWEDKEARLCASGAAKGC